MDRNRERRAELGAAVRVGRGLGLGAVLSGAGGERGEPGADVLGRAVHAHAVLRDAANGLVAWAAQRCRREWREAQAQQPESAAAIQPISERVQ